MSSAIDQAAAKLKRWKNYPATFVNEELHVDDIDDWQLDGLNHFNSHQRIAIKSNKGPGKTCLLSWLGWLFLITRRHPKVMATSITGANLRSGLWTEMSKWYARSKFLQDQFVVNNRSIVCRAHASTWWMEARTWQKDADSEQQADTLAGFHAENTLALCDEIGGYPDAVMAAIEAQLAGTGDHKIVGAGNPTQTAGPLWRACTTERDLWYVIEITGDPDNPKRAKRVPIEWAREQIRKFGRDNPYVLVNVFGQFPPSSFNQLLGPNDIQKVFNGHLRIDEYDFAQKRLGIDVARFGDDETVIMGRQGKAVFRPQIMRLATNPEIASRAVMVKAKFGSEMEFVDGTGGFGGGVVDIMRLGGFSSVREIHFSSKPDDERFHNKRAEMWFRMTEAIKGGMVLPPDDTLAKELVAPTYTMTPQGKLIIEAKDQIKERLGFSPDRADALALTFAWPEMPSLTGLPFDRPMNNTQHGHDPFA